MKDRPAMATQTVMIENERVRVSEWRFSDGAETGHHRHEYDYIVVPMTTGDLKMVEIDGSENIASLAKGRPYFRSKGVEHNVINASGGDFAFIEIELL